MNPGHIINLSKQAVRNGPNTLDGRLFQELTTLLSSSHPAPFLARVPKPYIATESEEIQLKTLLKEWKRRAASSPRIDDARKDLHNWKDLARDTYGVTPVNTMNTIFNVLYHYQDTKAVGSFVDAGSGEGIPTLAAALSGRFPNSKGLEYNRMWHQWALGLKSIYDEQNRGKEDSLEFICDDLMDSSGPTHFSGASCVFVNGVTFGAQLCHSISKKLEQELGSKTDEVEEDIFVVSMSRRLALPSFDLVDVLSLNANGDGTFTFYVHRKAQRESSHTATTDSQELRTLRHHGDDLLDELLETSLQIDPDAGLKFAASIASSEPTVRENLLSSKTLWKILEQSLSSGESLIQRAIASMVLRAMVDHSVGRYAVASANNETVILRLLGCLENIEEHPAIRANLLDVLIQLLHDSPLTDVTKELDELVNKLDFEHQGGHLSPDLLESLKEMIAMREWWNGKQKTFPSHVSPQDRI